MLVLTASDTGALCLIGLVARPASWVSSEVPTLILNALKYFSAQAGRGRAAGQAYLARPALTNSAFTLSQNPATAVPQIIGHGMRRNGHRHRHVFA